MNPFATGSSAVPRTELCKTIQANNQAMHRHLAATLFASVILSAATFAAEVDKKTVVPATPEDDHWKFVLAVPGWMAGLEGTVGVDGVNSNIDLGFDTIL